MGETRTYSIGRDRTADIPIADDSVSRLHAQLTVGDSDELLLTDCGSTNGTFLVRANGVEEAVSQARVALNETVKFGSVAVTARDLVDLVRKLGRVKTPPPPRPASATPMSDPYPMPHSERLVRCGCGAVRSARQACVLCGE